MVFINNRIKLGIIILDDRGDNRKEVYWSFADCLIDYLGLEKPEKLQEVVAFMPEELFKSYDQYEHLEDSDYVEARDFLHYDKRLDEADLVVLDVDWAPGTNNNGDNPSAGNVNGIPLAEIISKRLDIVKLIFSGSEADIVKLALKKEIPHIVKKGYKFYPKIFRKPDDFNIESCRGVVDYAMDVFKKKRAKYLKNNCHTTEILKLIKQPEICGDYTLKIKDQGSRFREVPLANIFFECREPEQYKKELKYCYQAKSRFEIMKQFWNHRDVRIASHIAEKEEMQKGAKLLTAGTFKEELLYKATKFYYEDIKPEFGTDEIRVIEEFFRDVEDLIDRYGIDLSQGDSITLTLNNIIEEFRFIGKKLKRRTRIFLDELKKLFDTEYNVNFSDPALDSEWYCYVGDFLSKPASFEIENIGDDGMKGHLLTLWNTLDKAERTIKVYDNRGELGVVLLEIKGKLASDEKHDNGGAFDLHGSSLQDRIINGNNLKKIVHLLPHYFMPFLIESYGSDRLWHCINFSPVNGDSYEILATPDHFKEITDLPALNQSENKEMGVRYILGIERCK